MKTLLFIPLLLIALYADARKQVMVDRGKLTTAPGIGGYAQTGYAFAKGDVITINADAEKQLQRMIVILHPDKEIGKELSTKALSHTFTMPEEGIVIFRFISDRAGTNDINYTVTRIPASAAVQNYITRVVWDKPETVSPGYLVPRRP